jgi:hyperosmotically inducible protein
MRNALLAASLLVSSAVWAGEPPDGWITTKVKLSLFTAPDVDPNAVHVDTLNGTVILHGKVRTPADKKAAERIAERYATARKVRNLLQVVMIKDEKLVAHTDGELREAAQQRLHDDKSLSESSIGVKAVDRGVVLLAGTAHSLNDYLTAVEDVRRLPGVRRVSSEVQSADLLADLEMPLVTIKVGAIAPPEPSPMKDAWITVATKMRLLADKDVPALDVGVDTRDRTVTLFGIVPSEKARSAAEADALKVSGIEVVQNELEVVPAAERKSVELKDDLVRRNVQHAMKDTKELENVDVRVENGAVHLTGNVSSEWQRLHAATVARAVTGVRSVDDDLQIQRPRASR